jgi:hypothetical protein
MSRAWTLAQEKIEQAQENSMMAMQRIQGFMLGKEMLSGTTWKLATTFHGPYN